MSNKQYSQDVLSTESPIDIPLITRASQNDTLRLLHAGMGMCTEGGEFVDAIKKHIFYGKTLDRTNMIEELGDMLYYIALAADELGTDLDTIMKSNICKLKARYPQGYSNNSALNRDTKAEQKIVADYSDGIFAGRD